MRVIITLGFICFVFSCLCQGQTIPPGLLSKVNGIPGLEGVNLSAINQTGAVEKLNEVKALLKDKCDKAGGAGTFDKVYAAKDDLVNCVKSLVDLNTLNKEIEAAKPTGDLDIVFKKYCDKRTTFEVCVKNFTDVLDPCLDEAEKVNKVIVINATRSVLNFTCDKEGDRIALFIGTGGKECFQQRGMEVGKCINATYGKYIQTNSSNPGMPTFDKLPSFNFDIKTCSDAAQTQACIVRELEKCEDPTAGNLMDSLMTFVQRETPCGRILKANAEKSIAERDITGSSTTITHSLILLFIPIIARFI